MMRSISFVKRLELEFPGNHFSHALSLGDVDNDGADELVIGNVDGTLAVFKGELSSKPWKGISGLGTITCVAVGDVMNNGKNVLLAVNTGGVCSIFTTESRSSPHSSPKTAGAGATIETPKSSVPPLKKLHSQELLPNVKVAIVASLAPDGTHELFVGLTDRVVGAFRWNEASSSLELRQKWILTGQIGCLSTTLGSNGMNQLIVSQPGGTYIPYAYEGVSAPFSDTDKEGGHHEVHHIVQMPVVGQPQKSNPSTSTEVVGDIRRNIANSPTNEGNRHLVALCTLDGCIRVMMKGGKQWELQVDHSLFAITKLDLTGNGEDEIIACAWDGMTYIVDQYKNVIRYRFEEAVASFCAGHYGMTGDRTKPCLVYTTFSGKIYIYYEVTLPSILPSNLLLAIEKMPLSNGLSQRLKSITDNEKQALFHECLYQCHEHKCLPGSDSAT